MMFRQLNRQSKAVSLPLGIPVGELLSWAVNEGKRNLTSHLLENYVEVHHPAW